MTKSSTVTLELSTTAQTGTGWAQARNSSNGNLDYWYRFSGGNTDADDGSVVNDGEPDPSRPGHRRGAEIDIYIQLGSSSNSGFDLKEAIWKPNFTEPSDMHIQAKNSNRIEIVDDGTKDNEVGCYSVVTNPKSATTPDIYCDPSISNQWN